MTEASPATTDPTDQLPARPGRLMRLEPLVCRALCVSPAGPPVTGRARRSEDAVTHRIFNVSIALSAIRCLLSYVVFPIVVPAVGGAAAVPPAAGIPIAVVALVFDVIAVRRFWAGSHPWRWPVTLVYLAVMGLVLALLAGDIAHLVG